MKILVATDGSNYSQWACETVGRFAGPAQITAYLVHVTTPIPEPTVPFPDVFMEEDLLFREQIEKEHEVRAGERLEACRCMLPAGWQVIAEHRVGHPAAEILASVRDHQPDLVVVGARGVDEAPIGGLGSVSQKIARYAPCSVLVAREAGTRFRHALVALDHGDDTRKVMDYLIEAPWLRECTLTLAHVVEDRYLKESRVAASQFKGSEAYLGRLQSALIQDARMFLDEEAKRARESGLTVDTLVLEGDSAKVLQGRADSGGFDVMVMGSKGRTGLTHFLLGSTSQWLLRHTGTSVLLVRTRRAHS